MKSFVIQVASITDAPELYRLFLEPNFPEDELKPLSSILAMLESGYYRIITVAEEDRVVGAAFLASCPGGKSYLLDYLAVHEDMRSEGCGGFLLRQVALHHTDGLPVLIETESLRSSTCDAELRQRVRRNAFYQANGAVLTGLVTLCFGVEFNIWEIGRVEDPAEEMAKIYRFMIPEPLYEKYVKIPAEP